jgi:hypothetical protein
MLNAGGSILGPRAHDGHAARIIHRVPGVDRLGYRDRDLLLTATVGAAWARLLKAVPARPSPGNAPAAKLNPPAAAAPSQGPV